MLRFARGRGATGSAVVAIAVAAAGIALAAAPTGSGALVDAAGGSGEERSVTVEPDGFGGERSVTVEAQQVTAEPELAFVDVEPQMRPRAMLLTAGEEHHDDDLGLGLQYFAQLSVEGDEDVVDGVVYSVEAVHGDSPLWCRQGAPAPGCVGVEVGVRPDSGLMYLYMPRVSRKWLYPTGGFPTRRVDVSAEDPDSGLKVYRSVLVDRSDRAPDCDDYPDRNRDRFACVHLGEILPEDPPDTTTALQNALPRLVKPKSEYQLVFEELFDDGVAANTASCENGIASLDAEIWRVDRDPCAEEKVDPDGTPCFNVAGGSYSYGYFSGCEPHLSSEAGFVYKYGYLETKITLELSGSAGYTNYSLFLFPNYDRYTYPWNVDITNNKDYLTNVGAEVDIYEVVPQHRSVYLHQYLNSPGDFEAVPRHRSYKRIRPCSNYSSQTSLGFWVSDRVCRASTQVVTITLGLEWTPRGYLTYLKADGVHDDFVEYPEANTLMQKKRSRGSGYTTLREGTHFETVAAPGGDVTLEQMAVLHLPGWLKFGTDGRRSIDTVETRVHVDYVRVFQPENLYADMEPVYQ